MKIEIDATPVYCSLCGKMAMPIRATYFFRNQKPICSACFFTKPTTEDIAQKIESGTAELIATAKVLEALEKAGVA